MLFVIDISYGGKLLSFVELEAPTNKAAEKRVRDETKVVIKEASKKAV